MKALHLFCGLGGGALGFQRAGFETLLGVDLDAAACADFETLTGAPALVADMATLTPGELLDACGGEAPDVVFTSPPCKGFSGLLPSKRLAEPHYQALNRLVFQGLWLALETFRTRPPRWRSPVAAPRRAAGGADLLRQVQALLEGYGVPDPHRLPRLRRARRARPASPPLPPLPASPGRHHNKFRVERWDTAAHAVTGSDRVGSGAPP